MFRKIRDLINLRREYRRVIRRLRNRRYDFIFSFGASCHCTMILRGLGLQNRTYPFDWSSGSITPQHGFLGCRSKIDLICNDFANFIDLDDLQEYDNPVSDGVNFSVRNIRTRLTYTHDFPRGKSITDSYNEFFRDKYTRRANRLMQRINEANNIALIWIQNTWDQLNTPSIGRGIPTQELTAMHQQLSARFPGKQFDILLFEHDPDIRGRGLRLITVSDSILRFKSNHTVRNNRLHSVPIRHRIPCAIARVLRHLR